MMTICQYKSEPQNWAKIPQIKDWSKKQGSPMLILIAFFGAFWALTQSLFGYKNLLCNYHVLIIVDFYWANYRWTLESKVTLLMGE